MKVDAFQVVRDFETAVAEYTGASYAVALDSCTNALFLCCKYLQVDEVTIPSNTYVSVPCSVIHAGGKINFKDYDWQGIYQLEPYPIYDAAKRFTSGMYLPGNFMCLSFHCKKLLNIGRGGMILTDNKDAVDWFKQARFDGRHECSLLSDTFEMIGWNFYMTPEQAARGLWLMTTLIEKHNEDLPIEGYNDLSQYKMYTEANR